ncbi:MAG: aminoacyl-tRNA hydrolase [Spirochaetales bacterium]|nr:aminoacyl-tRNA hydrolase [Spirochaetales bacterium]
MINACVFLGNPGREYARTRHNAGWLAAAAFPLLAENSWTEKFNSLHQFVQINGRRVLFLKPMTMMNLSGGAVRKALDFFKLQAQEMLCVHDDLETEFGWLAVKNGGGLAGHNGLRSLRQELGTADFSRLKIGISRPGRGPVADYVLQRFSADEEAVLPRILEKACDCIRDLLAGDSIREERIQAVI